MSEFSENRKNFKDNAYREIVECYEQLFTIIQSQRNFDNALINHNTLQECFNKIQTLIAIEASTNIIPEDNFYAHLFLLRENICYLNEREERSNIIPATSQKPPTSKDGCFKEILKDTQMIPKVKGFQDIAGLHDVKKELISITVLPIYQPQLFLGQKLRNSVLLYGPPGTGKTQLAHAVAAETSGCLFSVSGSDILSHYVGQTEKMIKTLFETVKETKSCCTILFMDEIDGLCKRREHNESDWSRRLKTELMCQLTNFEDYPNVFLICATNCPWDLDPAFYRRFHQHIYVPLPNKLDRYELLQLLTKNTVLEMTSNFWEVILNKTEGYSGSDMSNLVRYALNIPLTELTDVKMWEPVGDNMYRPATDADNFKNILVRDLHEMPPGSIQARSPNISDLLTAVDVIKRTIPDADIQKYNAFMDGASFK